MKTFVVFFDVYGKKLKTSVIAYTEQQAKELVKEKILNNTSFDKITEEREYSDDVFEQIKNIIGL